MEWLNPIVCNLYSKAGHTSTHGYRQDGSVTTYDDTCVSYAFTKDFLSLQRQAKGKPTHQDILTSESQPQSVSQQVQSKPVQPVVTSPIKNILAGTQLTLSGEDESEVTPPPAVPQHGIQVIQGLKYDFTIPGAQNPEDFHTFTECQEVQKADVKSNYAWAFNAGTQAFTILPVVPANMLRVCSAYKKSGATAKQIQLGTYSATRTQDRPGYIINKEDFFSITECHKIHLATKRDSAYGWYSFLDNVQSKPTWENSSVFPRKEHHSLVAQGFSFNEVAYFKDELPSDIISIIDSEPEEVKENSVDVDESEYLPHQVCFRVWTTRPQKTDRAYYTKGNKIFIDTVNLNDKDAMMLTLAFKKVDYPFLDIEQLGKIRCNMTPREAIESIVDALFSENEAKQSNGNYQNVTAPLTGTTGSFTPQSTTPPPSYEQNLQMIRETNNINVENYQKPEQPEIKASFPIDEQVNLHSDGIPYTKTYASLPYNQVVFQPISDLQQFPDESVDLIIYHARGIEEELKMVPAIKKLLKSNRFCMLKTSIDNVSSVVKKGNDLGLQLIDVVYLHYKEDDEHVLTETFILLSKNKPLTTKFSRTVSGAMITVDDETSVKSIVPMYQIIKQLTQSNDTVLVLAPSDGEAEVAAKTLGRQYIGLIPTEQEYLRVYNRLVTGYGYDFIGQFQLFG